MPYVNNGIEDGFPIPPKTLSRRHKHPFNELQVGQSFLVECDPETFRINQKLISQKYRNYPGKKFTCRRMPADDEHPAGIRVWRVK